MSDHLEQIQVQVSTVTAERPVIGLSWTMPDGRSFSHVLECDDADMAQFPQGVQGLLRQTLNVFHATMTPRWTKARPTESGWYWWRRKSITTAEIIVQVQPQNDTVGPWPDGSQSRLSEESGEWSGPLERPS